MTRKKKQEGIAVGACSLCDQPDITFGWHFLGGIRYCPDCIKETLAWVQMTQEQRNDLINAMRRARAANQVQLDELRKLPAQVWKDNAIGEAQRRLVDANIREAGGKGIIPW